MVGNTLGHYRIVEALGSGGMGAVYIADDTRLHRRVALKVLPPEMMADATRLQRFRREAQVVAALNHPNVVTIYSVEECDGVHFLTMELVEGRTLESMIPSRGFALRDLLAIAIPLCDAIDAAHARGIIHRDLKPANVMIGNDGRPKVLDFGIAKRDDTAAASSTASTEVQTAEHQIVGTIHYMSPEQAEGRPVDHRTDIFSLGVILYEMATGRRPFTGDSQVAILSAILKDTPAQLPGNPGRIIARCLNKEPSQRYQSALDLKHDLEEMEGSSPIAHRWRSRWLTASIAAVVAIAIAAAAIRLKPERQPIRLHGTFTQLTSGPGIEWFPSVSPDGKWIVYGGDDAGNRDIYLQSITGQTPINLTKDSPLDDDQPAFSPDGESIVFRSRRDGGGLFVMGRTGEAVRRVTNSGFNPAWSPDGSHLAYATEPMEINPQNSQSMSALWTVALNGTGARLVVPGDAVQPVWSPHGKRIAFTRRLRGLIGRSDIYTIGAAGGTPQPLVTGPAVDWNPAWAPDGQHLYFCSDRDGSMNMWRIAVDEENGSALGDPEPVTTPAPFVAHISLSRDGSHIAFSSVLVSANIQRLGFDPQTREPRGEPQWVTTGSRSWSSPDPSPDGQWVAFYSRIRPEGDLYVVKSDGTGLRQLTTDAAVDRLPRWSPDGKWISMFSDRSGILEIWRVRPDGSGLQAVTSMGNLGMHSWGPDSARIVASSVLGKAFVVDPAQTNEPVELPAFKGPKSFHVNSWSPDGQTIAGQLGETSEGIATYSVASRTYTTLTEFGEWPAWFPDSRHILFVHGGKEFWEVDARTRATRRVFAATRDVVGPPRLTHDGTAAYYSRRTTESDIWMMTLK